jgi:ribosomal protein S18 acetylase RimI-like enzyme
MADPADPKVSVAREEDCPAIGRLLHDFNSEYGDPSPGPAALADRMRELIAGGDTLVLLAGEGPHALAVLRLRAAIWSEGLECYLAELYVAPDHRGRGLGRALMRAAIALARERGASYMDLNTAEDDRAARALYESLGFSNREGRASGPVNYYYEREL